MTRKDYRVIARAMRDAYDLGSDHLDVSTDARYYRTLQYETTVLEVASALHNASGFDLNGNRSFKTELFLQAAGYERRPDGSRYPV